MSRITASVVSCVLAVASLLVAVSVGPSGAAAPPGTPYSWGGNAFGELGTGTTVRRTTPGAVSALTDIVDLHAGREHVVALRAGGSVVTWGSSQMGQLGIGASGGSRPSPVAVPDLADVTMVSTGHYHSLALRADGSVWTWGYNFAGQLGDGTTTASPYARTGRCGRGAGTPTARSVTARSPIALLRCRWRPGRR